MKEQYILAAASVVGGMLMAGPVLAQGPDRDSEFGGFVAVGAGFGADYEGSDDYEFIPVGMAMVSWQGYNAQLLGPSLKIDVVPSENFDFGPTLSYGGGRDDGVEDDKVKLLREIDEALEVGFFAEYTFANSANPRYQVSVGLEAATDVNDGHDGSVFSASLDYECPVFGDLIWSLGTSATYADDNYMEAYFTIDADNTARSGLSRFDAEGGFKDVGLSTSLSQNFAERWNVRAMLEYTRLLGDAADSPVVKERGSENQLFGCVTIGYAF